MGRKYTVPFENIAISAVQDIIGLYSGASMAIKLHQLQLSQKTLTTFAAYRVNVKRLPATVTSGSVGASVTPSKVNRGDPAATFTARRNDTTQATTSGSSVALWNEMFYVLNGLLWLPPSFDDAWIAGPSEALIFEIAEAPTSMNCSGTALVEELF